MRKRRKETRSTIQPAGDGIKRWDKNMFRMPSATVFGFIMNAFEVCVGKPLFDAMMFRNAEYRKGALSVWMARTDEIDLATNMTTNRGRRQCVSWKNTWLTRTISLSLARPCLSAIGYESLKNVFESCVMFLFPLAHKTGKQRNFEMWSERMLRPIELCGPVRLSAFQTISCKLKLMHHEYLPSKFSIGEFADSFLFSCTWLHMSSWQHSTKESSKIFPCFRGALSHCVWARLLLKIAKKRKFR